jgi:hypothetical protein
MNLTFYVQYASFQNSPNLLRTIDYNFAKVSCLNYFLACRSLHNICTLIGQIAGLVCMFANLGVQFLGRQPWIQADKFLHTNINREMCRTG